MMTFEAALLQIGSIYADRVAEKGGRSLARVATIVAGTGAFFTRLERGATCTARNIEKFAAFFGEPDNWPERAIPPSAAAALASMGRPAKLAA